MPPEEKPPDFDFRFLYDATASLLGYFVSLWYSKYLKTIDDNWWRLHENGLIKDSKEPTEKGRYSPLFDFNSLDLERICYINGIYFYILSCHKHANYHLMNRYDGKQVLYLRGFEFESAISVDNIDYLRSGSSSLNTKMFAWTLGDLLSPHFRIFQALSPKDVYFGTGYAQHYFFSDLDNMIKLARSDIQSLYLNASRWKEDIAHLLDRMDYFVVHISSITESVLWELEQVDTDDRRDRVLVVFDEYAIQVNELELDTQKRMQNQFGEKLKWSKEENLPAYNLTKFRDRLSRKFALTTPDGFKKNIDRHCEHIAQASARIGPGARETYVDFKFHPALDADGLAELRDFSAAVNGQITENVNENGITCLPLFLNNVQLRVFMTLLLGEHHETGRALAAYAAVMRGAIDYYSRSGRLVGRPSKKVRKELLRMLRTHFDMAGSAAMRMLAYGKSHQFDDFSALAKADFAAVFDTTKAAVAEFFKEVRVRHSPPTWGRGLFHRLPF